MQTNDILWKNAIEDFFEEFVHFFFSKDAHLIDFSMGYEFLDKELAQLFPESTDSSRYVDKLVKVYLKTKEEKWILIHIEIQGYEDKNFPERMYSYQYRVKDRYGFDISALVIFTDKNPKYKPKEYYKELLGTTISYKYNIYKVFSQKERELIQSLNPFAIIVLATFIALKKGKMDDEGIAKVKRNLTKMLYERNYPKVKIQKLFLFLNYYIRFANKENTRKFADEILSIYQPKSKSMGIIEACREIQKEYDFEIAINKGKEIGIETNQEEVIVNAYKKGVTVEFIAEIVNLPISKVQLIIEKHFSN
jgi:hypothetical protein